MSRVPRAHPHTLALVAAAASWGIATAIAKRAVDEIPPLTLLPIELAVSVAFLSIAVRLSRHRIEWSPRLRKLGYLGVLNPGVSYALSLAGLARITASTSVLLWALEPIVILALAYLIVSDRISPVLAICAAVALAGAVLVVFQPGTEVSPTGVTLTIAGVIACAAYTVISTKFLHEDSALVVVLVQQAAALGFAVLLFAGSVVVSDPASLSGISSAAWASAIVAGLLYYAIAFWLYVTGLRGVSAGFAGMFINLVPVFGLAASYAFLDERLTVRQWLGASAILAAVVIVAGARSTARLQCAESGRHVA